MNILKAIGLLLILGVVFAAGYYVAINGTPWSEDATNMDATEDTVPTTANAPAGSVEISTTALSDGQRQLLKALGIDADSVTVTPAMLECAESAVGAARLEEIKGGATPSFSEGVKLFGCYTKG